MELFNEVFCGIFFFSDSFACEKSAAPLKLRTALIATAGVCVFLMTFFFFLFFNAVQIESSLFFTLGFLTQAPGKGVRRGLREGGKGGR